MYLTEQPVQSAPCVTVRNQKHGCERSLLKPTGYVMHQQV